MFPSAFQHGSLLRRAANIIAGFQCVNTFVETPSSGAICSHAAAPLPVEGGEHYRRIPVRQHLYSESLLTLDRKAEKLPFSKLDQVGAARLQPVIPVSDFFPINGQCILFDHAHGLAVGSRESGSRKRPNDP